MPNTAFIVSQQEVEERCGRQYIARHQEALHRLLVRAYAVEPRHWHYQNAIALTTTTLRDTFGRSGQHRIMADYFDKVGNHCEGRWTAAYRLKPEIALRIEKHLLQINTLERRPFNSTLQSVGDTGLSLPDSLPVDLAHLRSILKMTRQAMRTRGAGTYAFTGIGSSQTLETVFRQLLSVRNTVVETGGLPNQYKEMTNGRWGGDHDHHPLRLVRPTRYLTLGPQENLWDADLSNAHLAITHGLMQTWHPEIELPSLTSYLQHRAEWIDELHRRLDTNEVSHEDIKDVARAWLYGAKRAGPGSTNAAIRHPQMPAVLKKLGVWSRLYDELTNAASLLAPHSELSSGKRGTRLSYLLTSWETTIMQKLGVRLSQAGLKVQAWMFDGFLLIEDYVNPEGLLDRQMGEVAGDLQEEGFSLDQLSLKVRSVASLYREVLSCLGD